MLTFRLFRQSLGVIALAFVMVPEPAPGQVPAGGDTAKRYTIETVDGVKLKVRYFAGKGTDTATVLLLHNFDTKSGGDSQKDGWNDLAVALQTQGHHVFSFDFRGHGESTNLENPQKFFGPEFQNAKYIKTSKGVGGKLPETITNSDFLPAYYPFLVNDIAAVRAFIDRQNDSGSLNSSNLVVIGAGQGATLGALWMASEFKRFQASPKNPLVPLALQLSLPPGTFDLKEPSAGKDLAAAIWLTPNATLGGFPMPIHSWLKEVGKEQKVPMAFIYGSEEKAWTKQTMDMLLTVSPNYKDNKPSADLPFTGEHAIPTKLFGSQLIDKAFKTDEWITKKYLVPLLEKRTVQEAKTVGFDKNMAFWAISPIARIPVRVNETDKAPRPIPLEGFGIKR